LSLATTLLHQKISFLDGVSEYVTVYLNLKPSHSAMILLLHKERITTNQHKLIDLKFLDVMTLIKND